jgi:ferredoxin
MTISSIRKCVKTSIDRGMVIAFCYCVNVTEERSLSKVRTMKAKVNKDLCIGCELCVTTCPEVFEMNEDGKAHVLMAVVNLETEELCKKAADECPVDAISIDEASMAVDEF